MRAGAVVLPCRRLAGHTGRYNVLMDAKARPNHAAYLRVLRAMTPEQRLRKAFELTAMARALFAIGLRRRFPDLSEAAFTRLLRQRLALCHKRNS